MWCDGGVARECGVMVGQRGSVVLWWGSEEVWYDGGAARRCGGAARKCCVIVGQR